MSLLSRRVSVGSRLGLERVERLCRSLGDPQREIPTVHIAGTNGKGSTAAFLSSVLQEAGLRVGLYTSPHLVSIEERYQINGVPIDPDVLSSLEALLEPYVDALERDNPELGPVTHFEIATVIGFMYFQNQVDLLLLEVGLGGRLDATNVVMPQVSVIMPIGFDHMDYLGDTLVAIAGEKAGIIKSGVPVVMGPQRDEADRVVRQTAQARGAAVYAVTNTAWSVLQWGSLGGSLMFPAWGTQPISIGLLGRHQLDNAAAALVTLDILRGKGVPIEEAAVRRGMASARWPCRMELVSQEPWWLLDGAHNADGIEALAASLRVLLGGQRVAFVTALLENKPPDLLDPLVPLAKRFVFTKPKSSRIPPHEPTVLAEYALGRGVSAESFLDLSASVLAVRDEPRVCVCGSLYLLGEFTALRRERSFPIQSLITH